MCYTYDSLSRVTARTVKKLSDNSVISTENFNYDAAGNITDAPDCCFAYDTNNRLTTFKGNSVSYDMDGNMLNNGFKSFTYDSANRLITADGHTYTYNAENVRIRNLCADEDTTYTYDVNCKLSKLLCKTTNGITTKYVYGRGLIGEETSGTFKTYHFDFRGSTIAITNAIGNITDTFAYDTYGKLISRTGTSKVIFGYNGRDGVVTDDNGLIYMRARYYSPEMKRFINADIVAGQISNSVTLNRFAYANGNPVSFVDPFGLSAERAGISKAPMDMFIEFLNDLFVVSKEYKGEEFNVEIGNITYYLETGGTISIGNGPIDISKFVLKQIEISQSFDFSKGTFTLNSGNDLSWGIEYSVNIDDYNIALASMTINADQTIGVEYKIISEYKNLGNLYTTMGMKVQKNNNILPPPPPVFDKVTEEEAVPAFDENLRDFLINIADENEKAGDVLVDHLKGHPFLEGLVTAGVVGAFIISIPLGIPGLPGI